MVNVKLLAAVIAAANGATTILVFYADGVLLCSEPIPCKVVLPAAVPTCLIRIRLTPRPGFGIRARLAIRILSASRLPMELGKRFCLMAERTFLHSKYEKEGCPGVL